MSEDPGAGWLFLIGPARSGTSLLYKALCLHPQVAYISNFVRRAPALPQLAVLDRVARQPRLAELRRAVWFGGESGNAYVYGRRRALAERLFPQPTEGEPVFNHAGAPQFAWEEVPPVDEQARRLRKSLTRVRRADGAQVFVNKRIANNRRIPLLAQALPDARFVSTIRDGRAVAWSLSKVDWWLDDVVWWYGGTPRQWAAEGRDPWEMCARNWVEEVREISSGLATLPAERVLRTSYEAFVGHPVDTLAKIADFAGLAGDPGWLAEIRALSFPNRNEAWREQMDPAVMAKVTDEQRPELLAHGYDL